MPDNVEIARFMNELEARTAAAMLASIGIESRVVTDNAGGAFPSLSPLGGVRLIVSKYDEAEATAALEPEQPLRE